MLPLIDEWKPSSLAVTPLFFAILAATIMLIWFKRPRLQPVRWLLLGALLALALFQVRHQAVLAIVSRDDSPDRLCDARASRCRRRRHGWLRPRSR